MFSTYVIVLLFIAGISARSNQSTSSVIDKLLMWYDRADPPRKDRPTEVRIGMYINNFYSVSSRDMEYKMSMYLRQSWRDPLLQFSAADTGVTSIRLGDGRWHDIWTPDIFFRNEKEGKYNDILAPQRLLSLNATGHLWYVTKYTATLSCPMKLQRFPFDTQTCAIMFESFGYTMDVIYLSWLDKPVDVDPDVQLPAFTLKDVILYDCSQNYTVGAFPYLEARFVLQRDVGNYIMVVFIPSIILVIISWIQFYLDPSAVTGRVLIGLFCSFTLVAQMTGVRSTMPGVSYITSVDLWLTICLLFAFSTLLHLAIVQLLTRKQEIEDTSKASRVDFISRIAFPAAFLVWCIIYFALYN